MLVRDHVLAMIKFVEPYLLCNSGVGKSYSERKLYFERTEGDRIQLLELEDKGTFEEWFNGAYFTRFHKRPSRIAFLACLRQMRAEAARNGRRIDQAYIDRYSNDA